MDTAFDYSFLLKDKNASRFDACVSDFILNTYLPLWVTKLTLYFLFLWTALVIHIFTVFREMMQVDVKFCKRIKSMRTKCSISKLPSFGHSLKSFLEAKAEKEKERTEQRRDIIIIKSPLLFRSPTSLPTFCGLGTAVSALLRARS